MRMVYIDIIGDCITTDKALQREYSEMLATKDNIGISITYNDWVISLIDEGLLKTIHEVFPYDNN